MQLLLKNIKQLLTVSGNGKPFKSGAEMRDVGLIEHASVLIDNGRFQWIGKADAFDQKLHEDADVVEAASYVALPGFVDSHTHLVFAGTREGEFALRSEGKSYQEIAREGGGILSTVRETRSATKKELKKLAGKRLDAMMKHGTTTVEIKSGYGLDEDSEIKMLEAINELGEEHFMTVVSTFLGAHAIPPEFRAQPDDYVRLVTEKMLPYVAKRKLAAFCDVFCENGYFTVEQTRTILSKAQALGLHIKVHADELSSSGGSRVASELRACSADHLEHIDKRDIEELSTSGTVAVLLPGVSFFLNHSYAPARALIEAGVPVAIASDFNPGSCMSFSMPLMMTIACTQMRMTPEEAITASTLNGAAALNLSASAGSIEIGKQADIILYEVPHYHYLPYHFGANLVSKVIKAGTILEFP